MGTEAVLGVLHETERKILRHEPIERILQFICDEVAGRFEFAVVWIGTKGPDGSISQRAVAGPGADFVRQSRFRWDGSPEGQGPSGEAIRSRRPVVISTRTDERVAHGRTASRSSSSALSIPLVVGESVPGVLASYSERPRAYGEETTRLLTRGPGTPAKWRAGVPAAEGRRVTGLVTGAVAGLRTTTHGSPHGVTTRSTMR